MASVFQSHPHRSSSISPSRLAARLGIPTRLVFLRVLVACCYWQDSNTLLSILTMVLAGDDLYFVRCDHQNCGRIFPTMAAHNYHKRSCRPSNKRLRGALTAARDIWQSKKARREHQASDVVGVPCYYNVFRSVTHHESSPTLRQPVINQR